MTFSIHYFIVLTLSVSLLTGLHLLRAWLEPAKEVQFILSYWFANFLLLTRDLYIWFGPCSVCIDVDRQANFGWTSMEWIQPQFSFHWTGADMLNMASLSFCGLLHFCIAWKDMVPNSGQLIPPLAEGRNDWRSIISSLWQVNSYKIISDF